jgi:putative glycosyltransferase (TIGR04372 family)
MDLEEALLRHDLLKPAKEFLRNRLLSIPVQWLSLLFPNLSSFQARHKRASFLELKADAISQQKRACLIHPQESEKLIRLIHSLYDLNREDEAREALDIAPFRFGFTWRLLGKVFAAKFRDDGKVENIEQLSKLFGSQIRGCLAVMAQARLRGELAIGILGDEAEYVRLLKIANASQAAMMGCLGMKQAPVRYLGNYWVRKIGHLGQIEFYFKSLQVGLLPAHRPIILIEDISEVANPRLLEYWKQYMEVIVGRNEFERRRLEAKILEVDIHLFDSGRTPNAPLYHKNASAIAWDEWERAERKPLFKIDDDHRRAGWLNLAAAGVPEGAWFAVIHAREPGFAGDPFPSPRNATLENFLPAMQEVVSRRGWVIRIGDTGMKPLHDMPCVVDYAHADYKSDWMDIFLLAECRFFAGSPSGPAQVPHLFGVPTVYTNWVPIADYPYHANGLLIHKTHRDSTTGKKIPYSRFVVLRTDYNNINARNNIVVEENTADDIRNVVKEMLDRLDGKQPSGSPEDEYRQAQFRRIAGISGLGRPRLGQAFLEMNADLLDGN